MNCNIITTSPSIQTKSGPLYIDLKDEILLEPLNERKISLIKASGYKMATNDQSPIYQAVEKLMRNRPGKYGVKITIKKNVPTNCGLNSQNSNADGVVKCLGELWNVETKNSLSYREARWSNVKGQMSNVAIAVPKHIRLNQQITNPAHFPDLQIMIDQLIDLGAFEAGFTGKGSAIYGLFDELIDEPELKKKFAKKTDFLWTGKTLDV